MRVSRPRRRRPGRRVAAFGAALAWTVSLWLAGAGSAQAETAGQAQAEADRIGAQIAALQPQVDAALAAYDTALDGVARTVGASVAARHVYEALQARADAATAERDARTVALYKTGGNLSLYAAALASGDVGNLERLPYLSGVVVHDATTAESARKVAQAAKDTLDRDESAIDQGLADADVVTQRLQSLQDLLAQQQGLLQDASARAQQLLALQQAAAQIAAARAAAAQAGADAASDASPYPIPPLYRSLYQAAALTCPGLSWTVLAAIGQVETHHGSGTMISSAGALGPMQFMPATFAHYAVDGDHDGKADIWDPADAIFTAAHYLCANGAGTGSAGLYSSIFNYNHADWYVQLVLALAGKIS